MKLTATHDIAAPIDFVFARANEFGRFARVAQARGGKVQRHPPDPAAGRGLRFDVEYPFRGTLWPVGLELLDRAAPKSMRIGVSTALIAGTIDVGFAANGGDGTRVTLDVALSARSLKGQVFLGSLQVVRKRVESRLADELGKAAAGAEVLWRESAAG